MIKLFKSTILILLIGCSTGNNLEKENPSASLSTLENAEFINNCKKQEFPSKECVEKYFCKEGQSSLNKDQALIGLVDNGLAKWATAISLKTLRFYLVSGSEFSHLNQMFVPKIKASLPIKTTVQYDEIESEQCFWKNKVSSKKYSQGNYFVVHENFQQLNYELRIPSENEYKKFLNHHSQCNDETAKDSGFKKGCSKENLQFISDINKNGKKSIGIIIFRDIENGFIARSMIHC